MTARCPNLTAGTYCTDCGGDDARPSPRERGYDADWENVRDQVMREEPMCRTKCGRPTEQVDHIVPIRRGGARLERSNLQGLCGKCHRSKTNREDGGFGNPVKGAA